MATLSPQPWKVTSTQRLHRHWVRWQGGGMWRRGWGSPLWSLGGRAGSEQEREWVGG